MDARAHRASVIRAIRGHFGGRLPKIGAHPSQRSWHRSGWYGTPLRAHAGTLAAEALRLKRAHDEFEWPAGAEWWPCGRQDALGYEVEACLRDAKAYAAEAAFLRSGRPVWGPWTREDAERA